MTKPPLVTVLMCVYNGERYIRAAVESILTQTFRDFEFLIVNDGSTDSTPEILHSYTDPRIRLINNDTNLGLTPSLNLGMGLARGAYIARQDADDVSEPARLELQFGFMERNREYAMVGCWYREMDANGQTGLKARLPIESAELQWALLFYCPFVHSGVMLRKELYVNEIGFYDERYQYAQDHDLWLRTSRKKPLTNLPKFLVRYRINPHSMTATYGDLTNEGIWLCSAAIAELMGSDGRARELNEARFRTMANVLFGSTDTLTFAELNEGTAAIWELHRAFSAAYHLQPRANLRRRRNLSTMLGQRCIRMARDCARHGRYDEARHLLLRVMRIYPRGFMTAKSARLTFDTLVTAPLRATVSMLLRKAE